jgi:hypothetical protein
MVQIFLDCDGVLADFDSAARQFFGQDPRKAETELGNEEFLRLLHQHGSFYRDLPLLPDAHELYLALAHLKPIILTGCPAGNWAESQKIAWAAQHFPALKIITCRSRDKRLHMTKQGDVLVDDYLKYRTLWEESGGIFVHHLSAEGSIKQLAKLGLMAGVFQE